MLATCTVFLVRIVADKRDGIPRDYLSTHVYSRIRSCRTEEQVRDALKERDPEVSVAKRNEENTTNFPGISVTSPPPLQLNHIQQQLLDRMSLYLQTKASGSKPHPESLLLYGGHRGWENTHHFSASTISRSYV